MKAISIRGLTKRFGHVTALADVDLDVAPGEVVALLGENGAGKSTLLRILGTAVLPDAGEAAVNGHDIVADAAAARRATGFLLVEERSWYWRLTGRHNLEFFAAMHGMPRSVARVRTSELLAEVGLREVADRSFGTYSSGMRLRLSLARALLAQPPVLLLDEPTRSLDPIGRKHFRDLLLGIVRLSRTAVLVATHDLHEAAEVATRTAVLHEGRIATMLEEPTDASGLERRLLGFSR